MKIQDQYLQLGDTAPVFIVGSPRSGTSILALSLAKHPDFWTSAESDFLWLLFGKEDRFKSAYNRIQGRAAERKSWLIKNDVSISEFGAYIGQGINQLYLSKSGGRRWIDSTPTYTMMIETLMILFPEAKFIHIVRDGRAVVNSMINTGFDLHWAKDFRAACDTWVRYVKLGSEFLNIYNNKLIQVRLEDLVDDPEVGFDSLLDFLGAESHPACAKNLTNNRVNSSYGNQAKGDIRKRKDPSIIPVAPWNDWGKKEKRMFVQKAGELMGTLGYSTEILEK